MTRKFRIAMSERCFRFKPDALPSHAPHKPGVYEFVTFDAQKNPQDYRHLLVRITGYNAYFTSVGRELQNEVIARLSHQKL